jgi:small subunit ribosomal protein S4e
MSKSLKRLNAPRSWVIPRKTNVYTTKPRAGPHAIERGVPLATILRDFLGLAATGREARTAIGAGKILVDGRIVKDPKFAVGFMDVVSVPLLKQAWRVTIDHKARLRIVEVGAKDATWKLAQINNKTTIKGGQTQLNLHDGRNLIVKKDDYQTGDVLRLDLPDQKITGHFPLNEGAEVMVTAGQHAAEIAAVGSIEKTRSHKANLIHLGAGDSAFTTIKPYAFPIGDKKNVPKLEAMTIV